MQTPLPEKLAEVRKKFEAALEQIPKGGPAPKIDEYLTGHSPEDQAALRSHLEALESEHRAMANNQTVDFETPKPQGDTIDEIANPARPPQETADFSSLPSSPATLDTEPAGPETTPDLASEPGETSEPADTREQPVVDGYQILGELGRGGMGVVYRARHLQLDRMVALKMVLAGTHAGKDELNRFHTEAQAVAHLLHPNIVQIYEVGDQRGLPYFSLEFVDGSNLEKQIDGKPQSPEYAAKMVRKLATAMQHAHEHGVVHRDLKPANVLLTSDGEPKITDFGLAKRLEGESSSQTRSGTIMGTPSYMAPEQALGEINKISPLTDVYSLGAILYDLLTGRPPFIAPRAIDTVHQVIQNEPVPPTQLQPDIPVDVETICLKCLQKDHPKRYASAGELAADLERYLDGKPILARPVSAPERFWRWCRRNKIVATMSTAGIVLLLLWGTTASVQNFRITKQRDEIEKARKLADKRAAQEKAARVFADRKAEEARKARKLADDNAAVARDQAGLAVDTLYNVVTKFQSKLRDHSTPETQQLRRELLTDAFDGLGKVVGTTESSIFLNRTKAAAYQHMGDIIVELGERTEQARDQYRLCRDLIVAMSKEDPEDDATLYNLGVVFEKLGDVTRKLESLSEAQEYYAESAKARLKLSETEIKDEQLTAQMVTNALAKTYLKQADLNFQIGDPHAAWQSIFHYLKTREGREFNDLSELLEAATTENGLKQRYSVSFFLLMAKLSLRLEDAETSRGFCRYGMSRASAALERAPIPAKRALAASVGDLGDIELYLDNATEALKHYEQAHAIQTELAAADPDTANTKSLLSMSHYRLGTAALMLGNLAESKEHYEKCKQLRAQLAASDPENSLRKIDMLIILARCGDHQSASEIAVKLAERASNDPSFLFQMACSYALCAKAVGDAQQAGPEKLQSTYTAKAMNAIQQAISLGYKDTVSLLRDPDLRPLRDHSEYVAMVNKLK